MGQSSRVCPAGLRDHEGDIKTGASESGRHLAQNDAAEMTACFKGCIVAVAPEAQISTLVRDSTHSLR